MASCPRFVGVTQPVLLIRVDQRPITSPVILCNIQGVDNTTRVPCVPVKQLITIMETSCIHNANNMHVSTGVTKDME